MSSFTYDCGCMVTKSMFGKRMILSIYHCSKHYHLFSDGKTLKQMYEEIDRLN